MPVSVGPWHFRSGLRPLPTNWRLPGWGQWCQLLSSCPTAPGRPSCLATRRGGGCIQLRAPASAHGAPWDPAQGPSMREGLYALIASREMNLGRESRRARSSGLGSRTDSRRAAGQTPSQASVSSGATLGAQSCSRAALSKRTFCD